MIGTAARVVWDAATLPGSLGWDLLFGAWNVGADVTRQGTAVVSGTVRAVGPLVPGQRTSGRAPTDGPARRAA